MEVVYMKVVLVHVLWANGVLLFIHKPRYFQQVTSFLSVDIPGCFRSQAYTKRDIRATNIYMCMWQRAVMLNLAWFEYGYVHHLTQAWLC